jgi:peptidoglycan/LPS O-acetylase OafA/YrhL
MVLVRVLFAISYKLIIVESVIDVSPSVRILMNGLNNLVPMIRFEVMAFGGLTAYLLLRSDAKGNIFKILRTEVAFYLAIALVIILIARIVDFKYFMYIKQDVYGVAFCIIILNLATNVGLSKMFEYQPFIFLGDISYGIYMYHVSATYFSLYLVKLVVSPGEDILFSMMYYAIVLLSTIAMATASYLFLEKPFLKLKLRFG